MELLASAPPMRDTEPTVAATHDRHNRMVKEQQTFYRQCADDDATLIRLARAGDEHATAATARGALRRRCTRD